MSELIQPNPRALMEALDLSAEILRNIELSQMPLASIALKASRLARLLNDFDFQKIMAYEAAGYPTTPSGVPPEVWRLAVEAGRKYEETKLATGKPEEFIYVHPISNLEEQLRLAEASLAAAQDPDVAISSANPWQQVWSPHGNVFERNTIRQAVETGSTRLASRRNLIYQYALRKHYELKFSGIASDIFARIRERVDATIGRTVPTAVQRFSAAYENLLSENPEDWSNSVHSCRRILQDLADSVFPPSDHERKVEVDGKTMNVKLGRDHYINRIMAFIQDSSRSQRFVDIVGSHLRFIGERLDSVATAAQKGSHTTIVRREEADRYVVYTYLLVGDILSLLEPRAASSSTAAV
jgi:hypothetical protein